MKIRITNVKSDIHESPNNIVGANAMSTTIAHHRLRFPMISPHQSELLKSKESQISLKSPLFQYVYVAKRKNKIDEIPIKEKITTDYKNLIVEHPKLISDFFYQHSSNYPPSDKQREAILDIQRDAGASILSDYESNSEQSAEKFEAQIIKLRDDNPKFVPSPTLDMDMVTIGLFASKLNVLIKNKFQRFNVIYRPILGKQINWLDLSHALVGKAIWCNVVGIPQRFMSNLNPISLLSTPFIYGVHTTSLGYPMRGKTKKKAKKLKQEIPRYGFNNSTYDYEVVKTLSEPASRVISLNKQIEELRIARRHIIKKTFYSKYIPTKRGLLEVLNTLP